MTITRGLSTIVVAGIAFGAAGGLLGLALGALAPGYYRGVFEGGDDPGFSPVQVGTGLGIAQGLICGVIAGSVVVLAVSFSMRRRADAGVTVPHHRSPRIRAIVSVLAWLCAVVVIGAICFVSGAIVGQEQIYRQRTDAKFAKIRPVLRDPQFAGVTPEFSSAAQVYLTGTLTSDQAYKALEERLRFLFGDDEARFMISMVEVVARTSDKPARPPITDPPR